MLKIKALSLFSLLSFGISSYATDMIPLSGSDNSLYYRIGGGSNYSLPPSQDTQSINLGANTDLSAGYSCGNFQPLVSIRNTFNSLRKSVDNIQQDVIQNVTGSLGEIPMYALAQADPDLYNMLNNTLLDAHNQMDLSTKSCQVVKSEINQGKNPYADWATIRNWVKTLTCKRKSINNIMAPLRAIMKRALADNYIDHNPLDRIDLSEILSKEQKKSNFKIDPFSREEIQAILEVAKGQARNLYQFAFFTGLRPSELMGLRWGDVDWIHGTIHIEETIVDKATKDPKTEAGFREVFLLPPAREALEAQKQYTFLEDKQVFHNPLTNQAWETSQQLRRTIWIPTLKRAGVRYRNPYQTRHTYASMMISKGENILWVSKQMGHKDVQVTLKRYTQWVPDNNVEGGYRPHHDWNGFMTQQPSLVVSSSPQMIPQRSHNRLAA